MKRNLKKEEGEILGVKSFLLDGVEMEREEEGIKLDQVKEFLAEVSMNKIREQLTTWILSLYTITLLLVFFIYFAQGFQWYGFHLDPTALHRITWIPIVETAVVVVRVFKLVFEKK